MEPSTVTLNLRNPGWPAYDLCEKKLRFSSHPRAKVRHPGSLGTARAQPCRPVNCWLIGLMICQNKLESFTCEKAQKTFANLITVNQKW